MGRTVLLLLILGLATSLAAQKPEIAIQSVQAPICNSALQPGEIPGRPDSTVLPLIWRVRDRVLHAGNMEDIDFLVFNFEDIASYQFALHFDPTQLHFEEVEILTTDIPIDPSGNFGLFNVQAGEIRSLWTVATGLSLPQSTPVFQLRFSVLASGKKLSEVLSLDPAILPPLGYNTVLAARPVELSWSDYLNIFPREQQAQMPAVHPILLLQQNYPNPFSDCTTIGFVLPKASIAQLRVFDGTGRVLLQIMNTYPAGYNAEIMHFQNIKSTGIFYYELSTPFGKLTRKMQTHSH